MRSSIHYLFLVILIYSCASQGKENEQPVIDSLSPADIKPIRSADYFIMKGDSAEIPSFEIVVQLDGKAEKEIKEKKESIMIAAYFSGIPKDSTKYAEDGEYPVADKRIELADSRIADFSGIKISKAMYESLADKDIEVSVNIFSGRRSSEFNLLDCEILQKPVSQVKGQRFVLKGKLIGK